MYERVGEEIKRRVRFLVIRRTLLTAVLVIAAVAAVGSNNEDMVAPAIIAGIIVIIWVYSSARLQYLLLYGYGELIDKVSDLEARSQGGKKGGRKPPAARRVPHGAECGAGAGTGLQRRGPAQDQAPAGRQLEMHVLRPHEPFRQGLLPEVRGGSIFRSAVTEFFSAPGAGQTGFRLFGPVRRKSPGKSRHFPGKNSCAGSVFVVNYCIVRKC